MRGTVLLNCGLRVMIRMVEFRHKMCFPDGKWLCMKDCIYLLLHEELRLALVGFYSHIWVLFPRMQFVFQER